MHHPALTQENDTHKLLWDFDKQTDHLISARRPDHIIKKELAKLSTLLSRLTRGRRYNTKASRIFRFQWLRSLSVDISFIYYTASFSVDSVSEPNMASPCVVPKCKGNYKNGPRVHCFSFPKSKHLFDKWK